MALKYRPFERRGLEALRSGVQAGLSPDVAYSIFSDIQQGPLDRLAHQREKRLGLAQLMPEVADFAANAATAGLPPAFTEAAYAGFGSPLVKGGLDQLLGSLYSGGTGLSPYAEAPVSPELMNAPAALTDPLSGFDMAAFVANIRQAVMQGVPSEEVRRVILGSPNAAEYLKFQPYLDQVIEQLYANTAPPAPSPIPAPQGLDQLAGRSGGRPTSSQVTGAPFLQNNFLTDVLRQLGL